MSRRSARSLKFITAGSLGVLLLVMTGCSLWSSSSSRNDIPSVPTSVPSIPVDVDMRPIDYRLNFDADRIINTNTTADSAPLKIRLFKLKTPEEFLNADFFSLQNNSTGVLGDSLIGSEQFFLVPGQKGKLISGKTTPGFNYFGVMGEYRNLSGKKWKLVLRAPRVQTKPVVRTQVSFLDKLFFWRPAPEPELVAYRNDWQANVIVTDKGVINSACKNNNKSKDCQY